jgi:tetratricopeptide (TPR) repeat protein
VTPGPISRGEAAALLALLLLLLALTVTPIANNDLFIHLKTGETILKTGSVPRVDDYSAVARGRPYIAHEWLAGVVFKLVQAAAGWNGLILLKALVAIAVAALLYAAARQSGVPPDTGVAALAFVLILAASRFMERPHIFTSLMIAAFLLLLTRRRLGRRAPVWAFLVLQIVWANLHGGFLLGPVIVALAAAAAAIDRILERRAAVGPPRRAGPGSGSPLPPDSSTRAAVREPALLGLLAVGLVLVSLVNPYGPGLLKFPFALTGSSFMGEIYEWLPPLVAFDFRNGTLTLSPYASTYMARYYLAWIGFGILSFGLAAARWRRGHPPPQGGAFGVLLFSVFLVLSLRMNRNVADFALATFPGVMTSFTSARGDDRRISTLPWIAAALLVVAAWFAVVGYPYSPALRRRTGLGLGRNIPVAAADYLARIGMHGNVFNTYASGGYLIDRLYPAVRVAMDSRNDVYGEDLYRQYSRALSDADALDALLDRLDAAAVLLEWPNQGMMTAAAAVHRLKTWTPVFFDDVAVIYLRADGPWAKVTERDAYTLLDPALYRGGAIRRENAARALAEAERAQAQGGSYIARVIRIDALYGLGRDREALQDEDRLLKEDPPLFHIYTHLGWIRLARGDRAEAAERFRRALHYQPDSQVAMQGLALAQGSASP